MHLNNTCFSVSSSPHLQSSYFYVILSLPLTGQTSFLYHQFYSCTTLPSAKLSFLGLSFICAYSLSLSVSLKPNSMLSYCILSQIYFFHHSPSTFIPRFNIPFTLTFSTPIAQTCYICACILTTILICIISQSNMLYQSLTPNSLQTPLNIHFTIAFASLSSKLLHPVSLLISPFLTFPTSQSHLPIPFCLTSKSSHSPWYHARAPHPDISLFTTILLCQPHIYFLTLLQHILPFQVYHLPPSL